MENERKVLTKLKEMTDAGLLVWTISTSSKTAVYRGLEFTVQFIHDPIIGGNRLTISNLDGSSRMTAHGELVDQLAEAIDQQGQRSTDEYFDSVLAILNSGPTD